MIKFYYSGFKNQEAEARVRQLIEENKSLFPWWVAIAHIEGPRDGDSGQASIFCSPHLMEVRVRVHTAFFTLPEAEQSVTIAHELGHSLIADMCEFVVDAFLDPLKERNHEAWAGLDERWKYWGDRTAESIARQISLRCSESESQAPQEAQDSAKILDRHIDSIEEDTGSMDAATRAAARALRAVRDEIKASTQFKTEAYDNSPWNYSLSWAPPGERLWVVIDRGGGPYHDIARKHSHSGGGWHLDNGEAVVPVCWMEPVMPEAKP